MAIIGGLVALVIATGLGALAHRLGTLVLVIVASGFAVGTVAGLNMSTMTISSPCMFKSAPTTKSCALIKNPHSLCSFKSVSKAFGLKSLSFFRVLAMAVFKVQLIGLDGQESEFEALDDAYILDSAENEGLELPYLCKAGVCSTCAGLMVFGLVVPG